MKKTVLLVWVLTLIMVVPSFATQVTYEYTINGRDLMNYVTADGTDGSTAIDNDIYNGARLYRNIDSRSYINSEKDSFTNWANNTTDRLADFNLWGYDGNGANWGEIYKVYSWGDTPTSSDSAWDGYIIDWPWGSFDNYANGKTGYGDHYNDGKLLGWGANDYSAGLDFSGTNNPTFTFQMTLNMDDPAFGSSSPWYDGVEGQMVFWFGGSMLTEGNEWVTNGIYEGNIILQGEQQPVPEPSTILLMGIGLLGLVGYSRKRSKKS